MALMVMESVTTVKKWGFEATAAEWERERDSKRAA